MSFEVTLIDGRTLRGWKALPYMPALVICLLAGGVLIAAGLFKLAFRKVLR